MAYQPFGDSLRFNPHFHALILEGGFDSTGQFKRPMVRRPSELRTILRHLIKIGRAPPGLDPSSLN